jgi:4-hydroxybenzoate polyprenyltransferase
MTGVAGLRHFLDAIKVEHTVFALPFAYLGMVLAARGWPGWHTFIWITVAMVGARTTAMAANRLIDRRVDALTAAALAAVGWTLGLGLAYWVGWLVVVGLLVYEHSLVSADDLSRLDVAFFNVNGYISVITFLAALAGLWF